MMETALDSVSEDSGILFVIWRVGEVTVKGFVFAVLNVGNDAIVLKVDLTSVNFSLQDFPVHGSKQ